MKTSINLTAAICFGLAAAFFGTGCESDTVVQRQTTTETTSSPLGIYGSSQTRTSTTTVLSEDD